MWKLALAVGWVVVVDDVLMKTNFKSKLLDPPRAVFFCNLPLVPLMHPHPWILHLWVVIGVYTNAKLSRPLTLFLKSTCQTLGTSAWGAERAGHLSRGIVRVQRAICQEEPTSTA
eukprot:2352283-Amphidinium_carterae.1